MINEFFKSIFRTLGRIAAYILLGVLAYLILSWFGLPNVKAESINNTTNHDNYYFNSFNVNWNFNTNGYGRQFVDANADIIGFDASPFYNNYIVPQSGEYSITIDFRVMSKNNITMYQPNFSLQFYNGNWITASCDGTSNNQVISNGTTTWLSQTVLYMDIRYTCSSLNINQTFSQMRFRIWNSNTRYFYIKMNNYTFADLRELNSDTQSIINNNNENTTNIINNNNQNTQQIINSNNQTTSAVEDLGEAMLDDSDADLGFVEEIADWMPIDTPVTDIITLPINILNKTINSFGGTCQPYTINTGSLLGNYSWTFPCLNIGQYFTNYSYQGYNLWQLIDLMICMYMGYEILMLIMSAYNSIANLEDPFESLYQPKHVGYAMKHGEGRL